MRISVIGAQCVGKTTFIQDFLKQWPMYSSPKEKYTDFKKSDKEFSLNEEGTEDSQRKILNFLVEQIINKKETDNVILDRSVLDNLVYTMWLNGYDKVENSFVKETINIVKNTLIFYDIIFFCPITKFSPIILENEGHRSINPNYREEIDNLFKALMKAYYEGNTIYFPLDHELGCPAFIEIFGNREERIELTKMYIAKDGKPYGEDQSLLDSELTPEEEALQQFVENLKSGVRVPNKNIIIPKSVSNKRS